MTSEHWDIVARRWVAWYWVLKNLPRVEEPKPQRDDGKDKAPGTDPQEDETDPREGTGSRGNGKENGEQEEPIQAGQ